MDQNLSWAKVRSIPTQLANEEDDQKSSSTFNIENCGDCKLSDVSSCSELDLEESNIPALRTDPAIDLGDAFDLFETEDEEETSSSSSSSSTSGGSSGSVAACALSCSSTNLFKCWEDPQVASCRRTDRLFSTPTDHDWVNMSVPALYRTESDLTLVSLDEDDVHLSNTHRAGVEPVAPVLVSSSGGASAAVSGGGLSEAWAELEHVLESNMASLQQEVTVHLDGVQDQLTAELQLRKRLREEERWAERHRQGRRLEGLPTWLRRLGDVLKGLVKTRPKSGRFHRPDSAAATESAASAAGGEVSGHKELCHVAQSACHSQVVLERTRAKYAQIKERQATARDELILGQVLEELDDLERIFRKQQELMLQEVESTLNRLLGTENSEGPVDLEEEKRSEEDIKIKPKKKGLKRFFKCLCCLN
ncbi:uncharacterized protein LOC134097395 [Sardina pilchardus]|uniref:uncharacterized protein LOC134097395 n=1 Tax=Sardina pilchardus TaxID=27697 RepID=UPI002E162295